MWDVLKRLSNFLKQLLTIFFIKKKEVPIFISGLIHIWLNIYTRTTYLGLIITIQEYHQPYLFIIKTWLGVFLWKKRTELCGTWTGSGQCRWWLLRWLFLHSCKGCSSEHGGHPVCWDGQTGQIPASDRRWTAPHLDIQHAVSQPISSALFTAQLIKSFSSCEADQCELPHLRCQSFWRLLPGSPRPAGSFHRQRWMNHR